MLLFRGLTEILFPHIFCKHTFKTKYLCGFKELTPISLKIGVTKFKLIVGYLP